MATHVEPTRWKPSYYSFVNREDAGRQVGEALLRMEEPPKNPILLGCPRGGVVVAKAVHDYLQSQGISSSLDCVICRKIPKLDNPEYGIGAVTETGTPFFLDHVVEQFGIDTTSSPMQTLIKSVQEEVRKRMTLYRQGKPLMSLEGRTVVIVDDGIAGGVTAIAAIKSVQELSARRALRIVVATPVMTEKAQKQIMDLTGLAEKDFCTAVIAQPPKGSYWDIEDFYASEGFKEISHEEVIALLRPS